MNVSLVKRNGDVTKSKIKELHTFEGLGRAKAQEVSSGDICALVGIDGFEIGDTVCDYENPEALPPIAIDEPTMEIRLFLPMLCVVKPRRNGHHNRDTILVALF